MAASTGSDERVAETYQTLVDVCPDAWRGLEPAANSNLLGLLHDVTTARSCPVDGFISKAIESRQ